MSLWAWIVLSLTGICSSAVATIVGTAGGYILLSVLVSFVEVQSVVPIHGMVQLVSNTSRITLFFRSIRLDIVWRYCLAAIPGALIGISLVSVIHPITLKIALALFVLIALHKPKRYTSRRIGIHTFWFVGAGAGFIGMIVGAISPFIAPFFIRSKIPKNEFIATVATCQGFVHLMKLPLFTAIGFDFLKYAGLIGALSVAVLIGTLIGKRIVNRISQETFARIVKWVLTASAIKILIVDVGYELFYP